MDANWGILDKLRVKLRQIYSIEIFKCKIFNIFIKINPKILKKFIYLLKTLEILKILKIYIKISQIIHKIHK